MKKTLLWILFAMLLSQVWSIKVWQRNNKWFDINFLSESEFAHSFIEYQTFSNHFITDNSLALDIKHLNFKVGICDYRAEHYFEPESGGGAAHYSLTSENQAVYSDVAVYFDPRLRVILSMKAASVNQPAPYYNRLSTPVAKITAIQLFPWNHAYFTLEGAYSTNLQTNETINNEKTADAKYVGAASHLADNTMIFDTPDLFDASKHHYRASFAFNSSNKRGFSPLPDKMPLIYTPNNTFAFKSSYDYYVDEGRGGLAPEQNSYTQKLSIDTKYRFWHVFELSAGGRAWDTMIDNTSVDTRDYDATAALRGYLYDFEDAKLIPSAGFRQIESYDNFQQKLMRLDRMLTFTGYACLKVNKNTLLTGYVTEDVMLNWYRNAAYPQTMRINYGKHNHTISAGAGLTVWY